MIGPGLSIPEISSRGGGSSPISGELIAEDGLFYIVTEKLEIIMTEGKNG